MITWFIAGLFIATIIIISFLIIVMDFKKEKKENRRREESLDRLDKCIATIEEKTRSMK
jgi:hypothetical protein